MIALGLPIAAIVVPLSAAAIGLIAWLLADTPDLETRSTSSIGALLSDATSERDDTSISAHAQECA